jgi:hypothetical protein
MPKSSLAKQGWLILLGSALAAGLALASCSNDAPPVDNSSTIGKSIGGNSCVTPQSGCPCSSEGRTAACGSVISHEGDHVECSEGTMTCKMGQWGACVGETTHGMTLQSPGGLHAEGITATPGACTDDPCDPYCEAYTDTPPGFDAGAESGITVTEAGVTLVPIVSKTPACTGFSVTPATENLTVTQIPASGSIVYSGSPSPAPFTYSDALSPSSCYSGAPPTIWTLDNQLIANISAAGVVSLVSPIATSFHVTAYSGGWSNAATPALVNVVVNAVDVSSAPSGYTNASFTGSATVADNITVLYPYSGTVFPLGLPAPTIQWSNGGTTANAVRVQLRYPAGSGSQFTWSGILPENQTLPTPTLAGQPRAFPPQNVWNAFQQTAIGNTADIVIQRIVGGVLREPNPPINITFATDQLKGTVYYQSYGTNLVYNYCCTYDGASFGGATLSIQPGALAPTVTAGTSSQCVVCHSVASSGANLLTQNGGNYSQTFNYALPSLTETTMSPANGVFAWAALSPDGTYLFSNSTGLYSASTQKSQLYTVPGGSSISASGLPSIESVSPSFSGDSAHVAFNFYGGTSGSSTGDTASIASMDFSNSTKTFSNFQVLATPGSGNVGAGTGTVKVTHNSSSITFTTPQTFAVGTTFVFSSQAGSSYVLSANITAATTATLTASYSGTTTAAATWYYTGHMYYPSYLPSDNQLVSELETVSNGRGAPSEIAETRSQCDSRGPTACQNDGTHAELWWTDVGTKTSAKLTNLNGGSYLPLHAAANLPAGDNQLNYEPTVNPQLTGGYAWVVFTSRREYGNIATVNPYWSDPRYQDISQQPTPKKLWVAAINPSAAPGTDSSYPAFYLPGQELLAGNSRGYWVLSQCEAAGPPTAANLCTSNLDCCPAAAPSDPPVVCALDAPPATTAHCTSTPSTSCAANGASCSTSNQCCDFPSSVCAQSVCKPAQTVTFSPSEFSTIYNGTMCGPGTRVSWLDVGLEALTPSSNGSNATVTLSVQASDSSSGFTPSTPVYVGTLSGPPADQSATWNNFGLSTALRSISPLAPTDLYIQVTFGLTPSADQSVGPTITDWRVRFDCVPSE